MIYLKESNDTFNYKLLLPINDDISTNDIANKAKDIDGLSEIKIDFIDDYITCL